MHSDCHHSKPRCSRRKQQYVLDRFQEEDPESYFKYKSKSSGCLTGEQMRFLEAISHRDLSIVTTLLERGLDPTFTILPSGETPLHVAINSLPPNNRRRGLDLAGERVERALLYFGSDVNFQDHNGNAPLHVACQNNDVVSVKMLIEAGADVNIKNSKQNTPFMCLCSHLKPRERIFQLLVDSGADINLLNSSKQNAFHMLCCGDLCRQCNWERRNTLAKFLLNKGLSTNLVDANGKTPLCYELLRLVYLFSTTESFIDEKSLNEKSFIKVALTLVTGGGLTDLAVHKDDILSLIGTSYRLQHVAPYLNYLFLSLRPGISIADYNMICEWLSRPFEAFRSNPKPVYHGIPRLGIDDMLPGLRRMWTPVAMALSDSDEERYGYRARKPSADSNSAVVQYNDVVWSTPPSLLHLSKLVIRNSLGGTIFTRASLLGLPSKMESFIKTLD